ncbi:hypothetical protein [uncultured Phenylobacterium sp.]|uniref:hypothetical protein n=1 Tax=uncultured Phenylobacterium sp. TaxID=349273 RepID=UPI0025F26C25|nr:hypothetical protein [uncultured Phenylobacterium sp.]
MKLRLPPFRARAFAEDPHAELDRVVAAAAAQIGRTVDAMRLSPDQAGFARDINRAHAADLRELLRKRAIREARLRGFRLPADFGAPPSADALAAVAPVGSA